MSEDFLVVRGETTEDVTADHDDLLFGIEAKAKTAEDASAQVLEASVVAAEALDVLGDVINRRRTTSLTVEANRWYDRETGRERTDGYRAQQSVSVRVADPSQTATVVRSMQSAAEVTVRGPWWGLTDDNPGHDRVRAAAAADARRRAQAYAEGLGIGVGPVRRVADPSARAALPTPTGGEAMLRATPAAAMEITDASMEATDLGDTSLTPAALDGLVVGEVTISATIEVAFDLA